MILLLVAYLQGRVAADARLPFDSYIAVHVHVLPEACERYALNLTIHPCTVIPLQVQGAAVKDIRAACQYYAKVLNIYKMCGS